MRRLLCVLLLSCIQLVDALAELSQDSGTENVAIFRDPGFLSTSLTNVNYLSTQPSTTVRPAQAGSTGTTTEWLEADMRAKDLVSSSLLGISKFLRQDAGRVHWIMALALFCFCALSPLPLCCLRYSKERVQREMVMDWQRRRGQVEGANALLLRELEIFGDFSAAPAGMFQSSFDLSSDDGRNSKEEETFPCAYKLQILPDGSVSGKAYHQSAGSPLKVEGTLRWDDASMPGDIVLSAKRKHQGGYKCFCCCGKYPHHEHIEIRGVLVRDGSKFMVQATYVSFITMSTFAKCLVYMCEFPHRTGEVDMDSARTTVAFADPPSAQPQDGVDRQPLLQAAEA
mmetsp:Transcript_39199/g.92291  ORF Transcript_39199/g.92291 Transcript_39199/m.92291 type:complete len:341 (-) Transcript_39199:110-1132(-)